MTTTASHLPLDFVGGLRDEEALRVGLDHDVGSGVDGDAALGAVLAARLDRDQQQLQLDEAHPAAQHATQTKQ